MGAALTEDYVGAMLAGAVIVNGYVQVPRELPLASSVSNVTVAVPLVAEGMAFYQLSGMVYEALLVPAATLCVLE